MNRCSRTSSTRDASLVAIFVSSFSITIGGAAHAQSGPPADPGVFGTVAPQSVDVRLPDTLVNQDKTGGANQLLEALSASPGGGYAAVWRDQRDGMLGLYLGRMNAQGELLEPERPIHQPHSGRRLEPAVALGKDNAGAVVWIANGGGSIVPWVRTFDARGAWLCTDRALPADETPNPRMSRDSGPRLPAIAAIPGGGYVVAWTQVGQVKFQELEHDGTPRGKTVRLAPSSPPAEPGVQLAVSARGSILCAWRAKETSVAINRANPDSAPVNLGMGVLCKLVGDPAGGFWAALTLDGQPVLRHLALDGRPDRPDVKPVSQAASGLDLTLGDEYMALLAETSSAPREESRGARGAKPASRAPQAHGDGSFSVYLLDRDGRVREPALPIRVYSGAAHGVQTPHIASNGKRVFVAWTDDRNGDPDVYGRVLDPSGSRDASGEVDARLGDERRVNSDVASSDQVSPQVAASGAHAAIVWQDARDRKYRVFARRIGPGGFIGDELALPAPVGGAAAARETDACVQPSVAVRADGDFIAIWKQNGEHSGMRAQCFHSDGTAICAPVDIDPGQGAATQAIVALNADRGYTIVWNRGNQSVWARRITPDGKFPAAPSRVDDSKDGEIGDVALALLDDLRLICAWDVHATGNTWSLRARFIDAEGATKSDELTFEASPRKEDWQPCVAPAANNGFILGWCAGLPEDASHDVMARAFDARGKPAGPLLPIGPLANEQDNAQIARLPDKTYAIAWEDDISGYDHGYLRRIGANARELGPIVRINELETKAVEDRVAPKIAVLGDGIVSAWGDRRRSQGWDVYLRILGPKFDDVRKK